MDNLSSSKLFLPSALPQTVAEYDYFFVSKGAEDRAYITCSKIGTSIRIRRLFLFDSQMNQDQLDAVEIDRYNTITDIIAQNKIADYMVIAAEDSKLGVSLSKITIEQDSRIAMDISSMNFWELQDVIYYFLKILRVRKIDIYYTEPDLYQYENFDITQYQNNPPQASFNYPHNYHSTKTTEKEEIFVGILGFQKHVLKFLQDNNEVADYFSINGFPSFYPKAKDISQVINGDYLSQLQNSHKFCAEANNPFLCYNALVDIMYKLDRPFMTICPLGSKPMVLGALMFALNYSDSSKIVYPYSEHIRTKTKGVGHTYCFGINNSL